MTLQFYRNSPDTHPDKISKSFCGFAFKQIHVTPSGVVKPCCIFDGPLKKDDGSTLRIGDMSVEQIWNSNHYKEIRTKMLNGEPIPECSKCIEEEKNYAASDRILNGRYYPYIEFRVEAAKKNNGFIHVLPDHLNLKFGNTCNLKCRMCQPLDSIAIDSEFTQISKKEPAFRTFDNANSHDYFYDSEPLETATNWIENDLAVENMRKILSTCESLQALSFALAGGEVTYTPKALQLLDYCIQNGYASKIDLTLSTNLTKISNDFISKLAKFRFVTVICSIDGVEKTLEYIRYPSQWQIVKQNYQRLLDGPSNILPVLSPTIQNYNILEVDKILELAENIDHSKFERYGSQAVHLTILFDPHHLNIRYLPQKIKDIAHERIVNFINKSNKIKNNSAYAEQLKLLLETLKAESSAEESGRYMSYFLKYTEALDISRNQNFAEELPELAELLKEFNYAPAYPNSDGRSFSYYRFRDNGFSAKSKQDYQSAKKYFRKAYELFQADEDLLFNMASNFISLNDYESAEKYFTELFELNPKNYYCLLELGFLNKRKENFKEAKEFFFLAMGNEPADRRGEAERYYREI